MTIVLSLKTITDPIPFGRYKGCAWEQVLYKDPNYLDWCNYAVRFVIIDKSVADLIYDDKARDRFKKERIKLAKSIEKSLGVEKGDESNEGEGTSTTN